MNKTKQTVIINGRLYDAATGRVVSDVTSPARPQVAHKASNTPRRVISDIAPATHKPTPHTIVKPARKAAPHITPKVQKSTTLKRSVLKKPTATRKTNATNVHRNVQRSHRITKFAPTASTAQPEKTVDHTLQQQAVVTHRAHQEHLKQQAIAQQPISSRAVKEHLLQKNIEHAASAPQMHPKKHSRPRFKHSRLTSLTMLGVSLFIIGGYLTYTNIPNLSIQVASMNAGINADLPKYQPNGFRINGPIAYTQGEVSVKYKQAGGGDAFTLTQRSSDWDPQAALDNYVVPESNDDYEIHSAQGLTVYTYDKKAVWVNGGILHIIEGTAKLSSQQIEHIAASM